MYQIFIDEKSRKIEKPENIRFFVEADGLYLIEVSARVKGEKQLNGTDDEDLRVEIDFINFPKIGNKERYSDTPVSFSGGQIKNLKKSVYLFSHLGKGGHDIRLVPDISARLERIVVWRLPQGKSDINLPLSIQSEDGDRRPWLTLVLLNASLAAFSVCLYLKRRLLDSDDVKIIVDGSTLRNNRNFFRKLWYFVASVFQGEAQEEKFSVSLPKDLHYIEFWSDRQPTLKAIALSGLIAFPMDKITSVEMIKRMINESAQDNGLDPKIMMRVAEKESQFNPTAVSDRGAKGIFQLMPITIQQIGNLGYIIGDPFDARQNINGAVIYFHWLLDLYEGTEDRIEKTLAAWNWGQGNFPLEGPFDWSELPEETKGFIRFVLNR